jgi:hypothetical protein
MGLLKSMLEWSCFSLLSSIGFKSQEIILKGNSTNVGREFSSLDEVVVVGYGTKRRAW